MHGGRAGRARKPSPTVNSSKTSSGFTAIPWALWRPRVHAELRAHGRGASRGRIERLMRRHGIRAIMVKPRRVRTTDSRHDFPIAPNLLERNFIATAPNQIWLADITYVETEQGWL